jgi:hypothetical protein
MTMTLWRHHFDINLIGIMGKDLSIRFSFRKCQITILLTVTGQDQKTLKNTNVYTPQLSALGSTFFIRTFYTSSFWSHFYIVFEYISLKTSVKLLFSMVFYCLFTGTKTWISAFRSKKQNQFSTTGSIFIIFLCSKKLFLT